MANRYMIAQDDDCHWYMFTTDEKQVFDDLMYCDWDEITPDGEAWLDKRRIDGPHCLTFENPKEE